VSNVEKNLDYFMNLDYRIEIIPDKEEGGYAFRYPELPGCITCAETPEQGFTLLEDAKRNWIAACLEDGTPIPEPNGISEYSGQFELRIPKSLHKTLAEDSKQEGISINQYCVYLLSSGASNRRESVR